MQGTWLEGLRDRIGATWDVLTGRAYAAYSAPDIMSEVRLRAALIIARDAVVQAYDEALNTDDKNLARARLLQIDEALA